MATFIDVFQRKEVKYRLDAHQHRAMLDALAGRMALDDYGRTRVCSMYFDTADWRLIERSLDKPLYKEKLRVRWYGAMRPDGRAFVEIKKKYKGIVYKRRVGCSYAAARAYLGNAMPYEAACARFPLSDQAEDGESLAPRSLQIAREIDRFLLRYETLRPSMLIACEREAYAPMASAEAEADGMNDLRITFDANIAYRTMRGGAHERSRAGEPVPLLSQGEAVMEIKAAGPFPLWLVRALDACQAYPTSFSKYGEAYRAHLGEGGARSAVVRQPAFERVPALAAASDARPHRLLVPDHAMKKGGRCA